jgi:alginate O-acetyltransferase complex protein AlgJ
MMREPGKLIMMGFLAAFATTSALVNISLLKSASLNGVNFADLLQGRATLQMEKTYRDKLFFKDVALNTFGAARYLAFGEGRKGVVIGKDGWLFSSEELQNPDNASELLTAHLDEIRKVQSAVRQSGGHLIVALVPEKVDIYANELGSNAEFNKGDLSYGAARAAIMAQNIIVPDIRTDMMSAKTNTAMFLHTDTHWTPDGAMVGANAIGASAAPMELPQTGNFKVEPAASIKVDGDLMRYVMLGPIRQAAGYAPEVIKQYNLKEDVAPSSESADLFGDAAISVALVGTSYSANENWDFAALLKAKLNSDVLNVAELGKGPFLPMTAYLASDSFRNTPPKLVVWEIPMRYLAMPSDINTIQKPGAVISASAQ